MNIEGMICLGIPIVLLVALVISIAKEWELTQVALLYLLLISIGVAFLMSEMGTAPYSGPYTKLLF
jgi:hypothetical protein